MDLTAVEEVVSKIQGRLFKNSNSYSIGMMKSHFRGTGLQFKEHQVYVHGDDVRFIDWKLLAKTNTPYVKTFEEERNIEIVVVIDLSSSMMMGFEGLSKLQAAINIGCLLCLLAKETQDYIHFMLVADDVIELPKANGEKAIIQLVSELRKLDVLDDDGFVKFTTHKELNISQELLGKKVNRFLIKKKEVVILSDFNDFLSIEDLEDVLANRYTHAFRIICPLDINETSEFAVFGKEPKSGRSSLFSIQKGRELTKLTKKYGKHLRVLNIEKRYLDDFIKEMV